ncbi:bacillithiol system redox-active protein YtxJ [Radiobacillus kanasensis]|uniref:bacillithiol system redox-active protein YtxJ n=1 Tax=Radiobacillus kanasensis TaxID=2844358 RepID=UPI001E2B327C|nr:bacillithiol system redox-active protein YtxJ [Radiobacillus kanasensis]UFT98065.1 bacillithiol system redox-active protein YtxJ [Radiobacillus kanasensis]
MEMKLVQTKQVFDQMLEQNDAFFLMKHSLTCPISARAKSAFDAFQEEAEVPLFILHVQDARELSNGIAEQFGIKHESPQVLAFSGKNVVWHDSHNQIKLETLKEKQKLIKK